MILFKNHAQTPTPPFMLVQIVFPDNKQNDPVQPLPIVDFHYDNSDFFITVINLLDCF